MTTGHLVPADADPALPPEGRSSATNADRLDRGGRSGLRSALRLLFGQVQRPSLSSGPQPAPPIGARAREARPATQIAVCGFDQLVAQTRTADLLASIERRTRLPPSVFDRECRPLLRAYAEFVQMLPASECHHHAQPGGLWIHALEVCDAALALRAGAELPLGAETEDRKREEHRWTWTVFAAALLHDVGKPVTDVTVTVYGKDPQRGHVWVPLSGPMAESGIESTVPAAAEPPGDPIDDEEAGSCWYTVSFDAGEPDYRAHARLGAMLLLTMAPRSALRWLGEEGTSLPELVRYLSGEEPDGALGAMVKRADRESVRRNLLHGPRTRFTSARTVPLIERLMRALRGLLADGSLPLNRPGAAGWIHGGRAWFVCARLADEVRGYLARHESLQGIPGEDRNDRLFDTWQEYGIALTAPEGGVVWRVRVRCGTWAPAQPLTVLCFPVGRLFKDPAKQPEEVLGSVEPLAAAAPVDAAAGSAPQAGPQDATTAAVAASAYPGPDPVAADTAVAPAAGSEGFEGPSEAAVPIAPAPEQAFGDLDPPDELLDRADAASQIDSQAPPTVEIGAPLRPHDKRRRPSASIVDGEEPVNTGSASEASKPGSSQSRGAAENAQPTGVVPRVPPRGPSPVASAFLAWVAQSVASGVLPYNEDGAMVHFVAEGALLLSPGLFKRFLEAHAGVKEGAVHALRQAHGSRAFARLQNDLTRSGWCWRNADENLHYYAFVKADGSLSREAAFYLLAEPQRLWNPLPPANDRIRPVRRVRRLPVPGSASDGSPTGLEGNRDRDGVKP